MRIKNIMIIVNFRFFFVLIAHLPLFIHGWTQEKSNGNILIVGLEGDIKFFDNLGTLLDGKEFGVGSSFPINHVAETGSESKAVFLLSNGTLMTVDQNAKMKISQYDQVPFEASGKVLKDFTEEPSKSEVNIDLDFGALIVKTKKLNKNSSFSINSPVGTAGIRGTEFQMQSNPGAGVQLGVTESVVEFRPPGGGQPVPVSQGNGLSVSSAGVPTPRPINPVVAQKISTTNESATQMSADISLDTISESSGGGESEGSSEEGASNDEPVSDESNNKSDDASEGSGADDQSAPEGGDPKAGSASDGVPNPKLRRVLRREWESIN